MRWVERAWAGLRESLARYRAEIGVRNEAAGLQRAWLGDLRGKRVLEIGCGAGNILTMEIARECGEYLGVDLRRDLVQQLGERLEAAGLGHARAEARDVLAEGWPHGEFDVIYAGSVLHAFGDIDGAARALKRLLKPGGVLVAWEPMNTGWVVRLARAVYRPFQPNRRWHYPLRVSDVEKWGMHFRLEGARGLLGWSKWAIPCIFCRAGGGWGCGWGGNCEGWMRGGGDCGGVIRWLCGWWHGRGILGADGIVGMQPSPKGEGRPAGEGEGNTGGWWFRID